MNNEALFGSVEAALTFAYHYSAGQSPQTPMSKGEALGNNKGLYGIDGAAQAGLIRAQIRRLPDEQRWVLTVRFGDISSPCRCCGNPAHTPEWQKAIANLALCPELEGYPPPMRAAMIAKVLCRRKICIGELADQYRQPRSTVHRRQRDLKDSLQNIERKALDHLRDIFRQQGIIA